MRKATNAANAATKDSKPMCQRYLHVSLQACGITLAFMAPITPLASMHDTTSIHNTTNTTAAKRHSH